MASDDMQKFLAAKHPNINRYFVNIIRQAFIEGEELDFTPFELANNVLIFLWLKKLFLCLVHVSFFSSFLG